MNRPAPVEITYESMRFLITHNPTDGTLSKFVEVSQPDTVPSFFPDTLIVSALSFLKQWQMVSSEKQQYSVLLHSSLLRTSCIFVPLYLRSRGLLSCMCRSFSFQRDLLSDTDGWLWLWTHSIIYQRALPRESAQILVVNFVWKPHSFSLFIPTPLLWIVFLFQESWLWSRYYC